MFFQLLKGSDDKIVRSMEKTLEKQKIPAGGRLAARICRTAIRRAGKKFNRKVNYMIARRDPSVANLVKDETVRTELELQAMVRGMTSWQRNQWARAGYPGLAERRLASVVAFTQFDRGSSGA